MLDRGARRRGEGCVNAERAVLLAALSVQGARRSAPNAARTDSRRVRHEWSVHLLTCPGFLLFLEEGDHHHHSGMSIPPPLLNPRPKRTMADALEDDFVLSDGEYTGAMSAARSVAEAGDATMSDGHAKRKPETLSSRAGVENEEQEKRSRKKRKLKQRDKAKKAKVCVCVCACVLVYVG